MNNYLKYKKYDITLLDDMEKKFILSYDIIDSNNKNSNEEKLIKIYYASGDTNIIKYSIDKERKILLRMKEQYIKYAQNTKKEITDCKEKNKNLIEKSLVELIIGIIGVIFIDKIIFFRIIFAMLSLMGLIDMVIAVIGECIFNNDMRDIQKTELFYENEQVFNDFYEKSKEYRLSMHESSTNKKEPLNINDISSMKKSDLEMLLFKMKLFINLSQVSETYLNTIDEVDNVLFTTEEVNGEKVLKKEKNK